MLGFESVVWWDTVSEVAAIERLMVRGRCGGERWLTWEVERGDVSS